MGIKGLNLFLKKKCPSAFIELPCSYFGGKRIAIDSDNILMRFMCRAHKEIVDKTDVAVMEPDRDEIIKRWLYHIKNFLIKLLKIGATPVFIFDGKYIDEKSKTQKKRRENKQKLINKAEDLKVKILKIDPLERTPSMITELRKKMHHLGFLTHNEKKTMIEILTALGIPVLKATREGEQLCAILCIEGKVDAVWSTDSDVIAFGCPLTITESGEYIYNSDTDQMEESFKCSMFKPILSALDIKYNTFLDLCIMSGCDFNSNIYGTGIGRSYPVLKLCKSIDNLPIKYHDKMDCLNYIKCREIFKQCSSQEICQDKIVLNINNDISGSRNILEMYGIEDWTSIISNLYKNIIVPSDIFISKPPTLKRSTLKLNIDFNKQKEMPSILNIGLGISNIKHKKSVASLNQDQLKRILKKYPHLKAQN